MSDDKKKTPDGRPKGGTGKKPAKPTKPRTSSRPGDEPAFNTVLESKETKKPAGNAKPPKQKNTTLQSSALMPIPN